MNDKDSEIIAEVLFKYASALAMVYIFSDKTALISALQASERRKGHATELLRQIIEMADNAGIELYLTAFPFKAHGRAAMTRDQLVQFYKKLGFESESIDRAVNMVRRSQDSRGIL